MGGKTAKTVANIGLDNPALKELLEGQAFYAALAPSQYDIPTTSTTAATQTANAKKQKMCAEHITDMMKLSKVAANTPGTGAAGTISTFANSYSAVEFPLWKVAVGASDSAVYTVPSGYCYANASPRHCAFSLSPAMALCALRTSHFVENHAPCPQPAQPPCCVRGALSAVLHGVLCALQAILQS